MTTKFIQSHGFLILALFLTSAVRGASPDKLEEANNTFGLSLLKELATESPGKNVFISPFSIASALQMTAYGATGDTRTEMEKALGISEMSFTRVGEGYRKTQKSLTGMTNAELSIANSIWYASNIQLRPEFSSFGSQYYGAKLTVMDFTDPRAAGNINAWVKENTKGKIERILDGAIPGGTSAFIANAVYFKGSWTDKFDPRKTRDKIFTTAGGDTRTTPFMNREGSFGYAEADGVQRLRLPYQGGRLSMVVVLPGPDLPLKTYLTKMDQVAWTKLLRGEMPSSKGSVALPKVRLEFSAELKSSLQAMGMRTAFSRGANFSGMSAEPLAIDSVEHKTFVEVNEEGTEAAAVTGLNFKTWALESSGFTMVVSRPYLCWIEDRQTQAILFLGIVNDPA